MAVNENHAEDMPISLEESHQILYEEHKILADKVFDLEDTFQHASLFDSSGCCVLLMVLVSAMFCSNLFFWYSQFQMFHGMKNALEKLN